MVDRPKQPSPMSVWSMLSPSTCPFPEQGPTLMEMYEAQFPTRASRPEYTDEAVEPRKSVEEDSREIRSMTDGSESIKSSKDDLQKLKDAECNQVRTGFKLISLVHLPSSTTKLL